MVDEGSRKILDNVAKEDDILNENVTSEITQAQKYPHKLMARKISNR